MPGLILTKPIFSEKAQSSAAKGVYTFEVARGVNKTQIKKAVEIQFGVKVLQVRTMNFKSEIKRQGRYFGRTKPFKKAVVRLSEGSIDLWVPPEESKMQKAKRKTKEKEKK